MSRDGSVKVKYFGARKVARSALVELGETRRRSDELTVEVASLRERLRFSQEETSRMEREMRSLGALDVVNLERQKNELLATIKQARVDADAATAARRERERSDLAAADARLARAKQQVNDRERIERIQQRIKVASRADGNAISGASTWTVNNSQAKGRTMVRELSKLMLRAYNGEADVLVKTMKPYKLESAVARLDKARAAIERLGKTMQIRVAEDYHRLRLKELELTADYINQLAAEKEAEREEKARLREERKAQQEMERERQRLEKERSHYENALSKLMEKGDAEGVARLETRLAEIDLAIEDVDYRAANIRAGYVYVISNVGSFGERMIKVGMTRRLDPIDRVKELSDASVPFNFDVHALFFSNDAVGIEANMHRLLAARRVNQVNHRREFFYATPREARDLLAKSTGELLEFTELPEAPEFRQSPRPD